MININEKDFIETVQLKGLQVSLVASSNTTEIIHHKLEHGANWALGPEEGWNALEYFIVLNGELKTFPEDSGLKSLKPGDSFHRYPVKAHYTFQAVGTTEFLYVSSQPIFYQYSRTVTELHEMVRAIEAKDGYTMNHCTRITKLSMILGESFDLEPEQILRLNLGSFFHDIGKIKIPDEILKKPGKLTPEEWETMKKHPTYGRELLEESSIPIVGSAGIVVEQHHERYDGKGYPKGLAGDEITIEASIISVVDSYDAMTTDRVYQDRRTPDYAFNELLRCRGTMYHPDVVDKFIELKDTILGVKEQ
ncbi:HD-GYP domain-containing protein [Robertmurraya korlensis]|uniref:HD-GYP domain-containing protein n=1 Tax=Robertmurraya korlensis TaxID=519977 RepID=UPI00203F19AE|nr:HD-GYP domain-containing protein [Robertmurraya korlensis]